MAEIYPPALLAKQNSPVLGVEVRFTNLFLEILLQCTQKQSIMEAMHIHQKQKYL